MSKNIVICCDGTGNEYGQNNTNVVGLFERIARDTQQVAFYDPGVGTFSAWPVVGPLAKRLALLAGQAFGYGLRRNIADAYRFLMRTYEPVDRVYLFGFSRGAYTVRCLAAMLGKCGLLDRGAENLVDSAMKIYTTAHNASVAAGFKRTYGHECALHFVGVWDTVASLGLVLSRKAFDPRPQPPAAFNCHAISIDERRKKFPVYHWEGGDTEQTVEQVWFAGVHSNVGGWYPQRGLSDVTLEWMLTKASAQGLVLHRAPTPLAPSPTDAQHESRSGFWRLWPPAVRTVPAGAKIHQSVVERMSAPSVRTLAGDQVVRDDTYRPENLPALALLSSTYEIVE